MLRCRKAHFLCLKTTELTLVHIHVFSNKECTLYKWSIITNVVFVCLFLFLLGFFLGGGY